MTINKKELTRLSPQERIKRLKLMEDNRKKEVDEIGKLIKDSMREMKTEKLAEQITPDQKPVDISRLFEQTGGKLERTAKEGASAMALINGAKAYNVIVQSYKDYAKLKQFYGIISTGGALNEDQLASIGQIGERMNIVEKYLTEGEKTSSKLNPSRIILYKLRKETGVE